MVLFFNADSVNIKILNAGAWSRASERIPVSLPTEVNVTFLFWFYSSRFSRCSRLLFYRRQFKMSRRRRQRERQKSNRLNWKNNNSSRAARVFVYFFTVPARVRRETAYSHVL